MSKIAFSASWWSLLLGAIALAGPSCSTMRNGSAALRKDSPEYLINRLQDHQMEATWFEAKAKDAAK